MNCERARELILTDALDDQIHPDDKRDLLKHLVACEACRLLMDRAQEELVGPFTQAARPVPPANLWDRIERRLDDEAPQGLFERIRAFLRRQSAVLTTAAALAVLVLFVEVIRRDSPERAVTRLAPTTAVLMEIYGGTGAFEKALMQTVQIDTPIEDLFFR
ncbi:MAG TPA: hypothetical protein VIV61_08400 [Candidatus Ozemobacteraceae bacterium]